MFCIIAADCTIQRKISKVMNHTVFRDVHELDGHLTLVLLVSPENDLAETTLAKFFNDLVIVKNGAEVEILSLSS